MTVTASTLRLRLADLGHVCADDSEAAIAAGIRERQCEMALCARIANKPATFEACFIAVFGRSLDGRVVRAVKRRAKA